MTFSVPCKIKIFLEILHDYAKTIGIMGRGIFVTKFYFTENQSFAKYSPKYMEISCLGYKTCDESDAFAYNSG